LIPSPTGFFFWLETPTLGRSRDDDFGMGVRSFSVREYVIVYRVENRESRIENRDALILAGAQGRLDIDVWFGV
jgi:hypothetical protein